MKTCYGYQHEEFLQLKWNGNFLRSQTLANTFFAIFSQPGEWKKCVAVAYNFVLIC